MPSRRNVQQREATQLGQKSEKKTGMVQGCGNSPEIHSQILSPSILLPPAWVYAPKCPEPAKRARPSGGHTQYERADIHIQITETEAGTD